MDGIRVSLGMRFWNAHTPGKARLGSGSPRTFKCGACRRLAKVGPTADNAPLRIRSHTTGSTRSLPTARSASSPPSPPAPARSASRSIRPASSTPPSTTPNPSLASAPTGSPSRPSPPASRIPITSPSPFPSRRAVRCSSQRRGHSRSAGAAGAGVLNRLSEWDSGWATERCRPPFPQASCKCMT
jgi:hypothetical protein